jgi:hypothetical protein
LVPLITPRNHAETGIFFLALIQEGWITIFSDTGQQNCTL